MKKIVTIIGARPQFIKHAPVEIALKNYFEVIAIHTGQHYDKKMNEIFFSQLNISAPQYMLNIGSHAHGKQTAIMLEKIEEILLIEKPDAVIVYGDTNSTLAGAIAASKLNIPIVHIEAGLRSFNKSMPEEINRILTDHVSSILFAPTQLAVENLQTENISTNVFNVGDVMYDMLKIAVTVLGDIAAEDKILVTLHRPYNVDDPLRLKLILESLNGLGKKIVFPIHPRTRAILKSQNIPEKDYHNIEFVEPVSYFDLIKLQMESTCVITDSGGIQKETYFLRKKCITLRSETEWIETLTNGWNALVYNDLSILPQILDQKPGDYIDGFFGVGDSAEQMAGILQKVLLADK